MLSTAKNDALVHSKKHRNTVKCGNIIFLLISGFFDGSDFSQTVLHFRYIKLMKRCSYFMYLHLYLSDLYEKVPKKSKN